MKTEAVRRAGSNPQDLPPKNKKRGAGNLQRHFFLRGAKSRIGVMSDARKILGNKGIKILLTDNMRNWKI